VWRDWDCGFLAAPKEESVRLTESFVAKVAQQFNGSNGVPRMMTIEDLEEMCGRLFFAAEVLQLPLFKWYHAIKFYRAICKMISKTKHS
jgi:hypothetical protein